MLRASTMLALLMMAGVLAAAVPGQPSAPAGGLDATWDPDYRLTNNAYSDFNYWSCQRRVVQGPDGRVHVVWHVMNSGLGTYDFQVYYKRYNPGSGWSNDTMISEDLYLASTYNKYASVAVDSSGRVYVVWGNGPDDGADASIYVKTCMPTGTGNDGWDATSTQLGTAGTVECPNVACTPDGHAHVTWKEGQAVAYREWDGSSWLTKTNIVTGWSYTAYPSVAGARDNSVHVAFYGRQGASGYYKIYYLARDAVGVWGSIENPSGTGGDHQMYQTLCVNPVNNEPHIVWQGDTEDAGYWYRIVHAWRTGGTWQVDTVTETAIADTVFDPAETQMSFTLDGTGHCVWSGRSALSPSGEQIRYRELSPAGVWGERVDLTSVAAAKERPSVVGGGDANPADIHVAWCDYRDGNSEMYYKHGVMVDVHDVGVTAITAPPDTVDSGYVVAPACSVYNYGNVTETYWVRMRVGPSYEDTFQVQDHAPGAALPVTFADWTPLQLGDFAVTCSTELGSDEDNSNDAQDDSVTVEPVVHDVGVTVILAPPDSVLSGVPVVPACSLANFGDVDEESVAVHCEIGNTYDEVVWHVPSLPPGSSGYAAFPAWTPPAGNHSYDVRFFTDLALDGDRSNDSLEGTVVVYVTYLPGWTEMTPMPVGTQDKAVKDGGWLVERGDRLYAAKGYKSNEFYCYDVNGDSWWALAPMPYQNHPLWYNKPPRKGSQAVRDGGYLYVTQGSNTLGFWLYDINMDTWGILPDVPLGPYRKKVKGGTDMVEMSVQGEPGYIYLLKGYKTEFYRFNTETMAWDTTLTEAPTGSRPKWDKGSWLVPHRRANQDLYHIYAHKAKYDELWRYEVLGDSWTQLTGMPFIGSSGRSKKSKDGGSGVWEGACIYALKGGNTQEFWEYWSDGDSWTELDTMPSYGTTGKKKRVKAGGDIVSYEAGLFFALKGNKTLELWRYYQAPVPLDAGRRTLDARQGAAASPSFGIRHSTFAIAPNPLAGGFATLSYSLPEPGPVTVRVFDVAGRERLSLAPGVMRRASSMTLDLRGLSTGVYLVRLEASGLSAARKLVIE